MQIQIQLFICLYHFPVRNCMRLSEYDFRSFLFFLSILWVQHNLRVLRMATYNGVTITRSKRTRLIILPLFHTFKLSNSLAMFFLQRSTTNKRLYSFHSWALHISKLVEVYLFILCNNIEEYIAMIYIHIYLFREKNVLKYLQSD